MKKIANVKTTFNTYQINELIGQGGNGFVYKASDSTADVFAIKILETSKANSEKLKRFKNEFKFCSKNTHRNIITVCDNGLTETGDPFYVMPFFDGSLSGGLV